MILCKAVAQINAVPYDKFYFIRVYIQRTTTNILRNKEEIRNFSN